MFKNGVTIGPGGQVRPCCMYMNSDIEQRYNEPGWREKFDELYEQSLNNGYLTVMNVKQKKNVAEKV